MKSPLEQFLGLFKGVSGQTGSYYEKIHGSNAGEIKYFEQHPENKSEWKLLTPPDSAITSTETAIGKSNKTKAEDYFTNVIDQTSFNTADYKRLRKFFVDLFGTMRTKSSLSSQVTDPHSLSNSDLDELFRSFGFKYSTILRGVDENPLEQKVQFFLDLVNLYKIKGTPRSLVEVLQYFGITEVDIYEFFLKLKSNGDLIFDGNAVAGTSLNPPNLIVPYTNATLGDPHWIYTESQIKLLNTINKINLPSKTPYIGVSPQVSLENAETSLLQRIMQDQYLEYVNTCTGAYYEKIHGSNIGEIKYFKNHPENNSDWVYLYPTGGNLTLNAEITFYGEVRSFLELYLSTIYKFNQLYFVGDENQRFVCYDGSNSDYIEVTADFKTLSNTIPASRADQKLKYQAYINTYTRLTVTNFLVDRNTCGNVLNAINPTLKNSLDLDINPYETLTSLLSDVNRWVRNNLGLGFINFGFVLFGMADFFKELKPVIDFFKPYRTRLLLFENLQVNSRLFNSILTEDSFSFDAEITNLDFITSNSSPCCTVAEQFIPRPILVGVELVAKDSTSINIFLSDHQLTSKYGIGLTLESTDTDPSIITCGIHYKTKEFFMVTFSSPIDTDNFVLNWTINSTETGGEAELITGQTQRTIIFPVARANSQYSISADIENDDVTPSIYVTKIIDKTNEGFTALFSSPIDSMFYKINWAINEKVCGSDLVTYGDSIKTVNIPLQSSNNYPLIVDIYDTISSSNIYAYIVNNKTSSSFDIRFSDIVTDAEFFFNTLIVNWFIPSSSDYIPVSEICGDDISQTRYTRDNFISPPANLAWKGFWQSNRVYAVNDGVSIANGKHYYCTTSNLSLPETRPDTGLTWDSYWAEYSYYGVANDQTGITFYSRETYDCGSNHDLGAVSDFRRNVFIEIQDTKIDRLKCPDSSSVYITNEVMLNYGNVICGVQKIPTGSTNITVLIPERQTGIYAVSASLQNLDATANVSIINCGVIIKTSGFFVIAFSDPIDTSNWSLNWSINTSDKAGVTPLTSGITEKRIYLAIPQSLPNYFASALLHCFENDTDIFVTKIIDKTSDGFTVVFSSPLPSDKFNLDWSISDINYGGEGIPPGLNKITVPLLSYVPDSTTYPVLIDYYDASALASMVSGTSLPENITYHAVSILPDGRILVTGGNHNGTVRAETYFGTITGNTITWVSGTSLPTGRQFHTASVLSDGRILITGGSQGAQSAETYFGTITGNTITWVSGTSLPLALFLHTTSVLPDGRILIACGADDTWVFRAETYFGTITGNTISWISGTSLPVSRYGHEASVLTDGRILITGGIVSPWTISAETYFGTITGNTISWMSGTSLPGVRYAHTQSVLSDGRILTIGGKDNGVEYKAETYSGTIAGNVITWVNEINLPEGLAFHTSSVLSNGRILITGGSHDGLTIRAETYFETIAGNSLSILYSYVISEKTLTNFTVTFSNTIDSTSGIICWYVPETQRQESYRQISGFRNYDEVGGSFDCPYTNDIIEILQEIIAQASYILLEDGALMLQEDGFALFLE
jgi:hypothetical protein